MLLARLLSWFDSDVGFLSWNALMIEVRMTEISLKTIINVIKWKESMNSGLNLMNSEVKSRNPFNLNPRNWIQLIDLLV